MRGGSAFIKSSTAVPASSVLLLLSFERLFPISFPNLRLSAWPYRGSRSVEIHQEESRAGQTEEDRGGGTEIEAMMKADPPLIQEAWYRLHGWYKVAVDRAPPPARATLKRVTAKRTTLYSRVPPPGRHHPGHNRTV